jgi:hypothetical protein
LNKDFIKINKIHQSISKNISKDTNESIELLFEDPLSYPEEETIKDYTLLYYIVIFFYSNLNNNDNNNKTIEMEYINVRYYLNCIIQNTYFHINDSICHGILGI